MKKLILITLLALPGMVTANTTEIHNAKETVSPFPQAKNGINIMPLAEMKLPESLRSQILVSKKTFSTKGYQETTETDANVLSLVAVNRNAKDEIEKFDNDSNPYDTHLKSSASKLKLSFHFNGIPDVSKNNVIGFAAAGGYVKGKGWDGIVEFISDSKLGICSFTTFKIQKAILDKETTEYLVNNKPSNKAVAGNWNTGFLYTINWYSPDRLMSLVCANKQFQPGTTKSMVELAKKIDKHVTG